MPSSPLQAVVGLVDPVAEDEAVLGQLLGDRPDRGAHPRVVRGQEADQRDQQGGGVERVGVVVLAEDAVAHSALEDLLADLARRSPPTRSATSSTPTLRARRAPRSSATQIISFEET